MKPAKDRVCDGSDPLNEARDRRILSVTGVF
jgi:hypothetical protein